MTKYVKVLSFLALLAGSQQASAIVMSTDYDFSGSFTNDNDIVKLNFSVDSLSTVTIFSSSWDDGGLDPILAIWDASGNKMHEQDDGGNIGSTSSNGVLYDHGSWDSYFSVELAAGDYTATIGMYNNFSVSNLLADGFSQDANPNFSGGLFGCSNDVFCGAGGDNRTADWAFHVLNVSTADVEVSQVPEPGTLAILALGLVGLNMQARRKKLA